MRDGNYKTYFYVGRYRKDGKFDSGRARFSDFDDAVKYALKCHRLDIEGRYVYKIRKVTPDVDGVEYFNDIIWEPYDNEIAYESLTDEVRDYIYRRVWKEHVKEDVKNMYEDMDDDRVERIAEMYVNEGEYDCNLSYWSNLENLVSSTEFFNLGGKGNEHNRTI